MSTSPTGSYRRCPGSPPTLCGQRLLAALCARGDAAALIAEMGRADPALAFGIYAQAMRRGKNEQEALRALVDGLRAGEGAESRPIATDGTDSDLLRADREA